MLELYNKKIGDQSSVTGKLMVKWAILFALFLPLVSWAQAPAGYYTSADGKSGEELKTALYDIIKGHTEYPYSSTGTDVWDILKEADRDPDNPDNVIGLYSNFSMNAALEYDGGKGWNREHVWAKSRGDFGTLLGAGTDLHHIRAADVSTNSARNNRNFDEGTVQYIDGSGNYQGATDSYKGETDWTWEPRDEVKGDVARMIFYMATRYEGFNGEPDLELVDTLLDKLSKEPYQARLSVLIAWHEQDPVSSSEQDRNDVVYSYQGNRNPYIDHPEYVAEIWGTSTGTVNPEPEAYLTNLTVSNTTDTQITLSWTDAAGADLPDAYLIKANTTSFNYIVTPVDGTAESTSTLIKSVSQGTQQVTFTGLSSSTTYYFKVFPYSNYGTSIDYKTDGTVPSVSQLTSDAVVCNPVVDSFLPAEGPAGTLVSIKGSGLTGTSSVQFGTTEASSYSVTGDTLIEAYVPVDAASGAIKVTTSCEVTSSTDFTFTSLVCSSGAATDLFISEYAEGSSYNKYVEIYNGTGAPVDLSGYEVIVASNGSPTASGTITLTGTLADGDTYILCHSSADAAIQAVADQVTGSVNFNGDDYVGLYNSGILIDQIGELGTDPGSSWSVAGESGGLDNTIVRKETVTQGSTDWTASSGTSASDSEWIVYASDTWDYLNAHTFSPAGVASGSVTLHPSSQEICKGNSTTFTIATDAANPSYQWKAFDGINSFSDLSDAGVFSGTQTATLSISDVTGLEGYQFYCLVTDLDAACTTNTYAAVLTVNGADGTAGVWTGEADDNWSDCRNWADGQVPDATTDVTIPDGATVNLSSTLNCKNLIIDGGDITLTDGASLIVSGDIQILNGGSISASTTNTSLTFEAGSSQLTLEGTSLGSNIQIVVANGVTLDVLSAIALPSATNQLIVESGGVLDLNANSVSGTGTLDLQAGGKIITTHANGLSSTGALPLSGTVQLSADAIYEFAAAENAVTGELLPAIISELIINQPAGDLYLTQALDVSGTTTILSGNLYTSSAYLQLSEGAALSGEQNGQCVVGELRTSATIDAGSSYYSDFAGIGLTIDAGTNTQSLGATQVIRYTGTGEAQLIDGTGSINRWFSITPASQPASGQTVSVTLEWLSEELNGNDLSQAQVWRREGTDPWVQVGALGDFTSNSTTVLTDQFSEWTVKEDAGTLPVSWLGFEGERSKGMTRLNWTTGFEHMNTGFEVQRSADGNSFEKIGFVEGKGNSNEALHYAFNDYTSAHEGYYRLKQIDMDGAYAFSNIIYVNSMEAGQLSIAMWPNPVQEEVHLSLGQNGTWQLSLFNANGYQLKAWKGEVTELERSLNEKIRQTAPGIYLLRFVSADGRVEYLKLIRK